MRDRQSGLTLVELLITTALTATLILTALPNLMRASARLRVRGAAEEIRGTLRLAQSFAVRFDANVGVKFRELSDGRVTAALYRDGDGDGVSSADIESGADPELRAPHPLDNLGRGVGFGFPPAIVPRDPGDPTHRLTRLDDPIRFNASDIASFSPLGTSTPGSVYLTDGVSELYVVRVFNRTSKTSVLRYDADAEDWQ